MLSKKRYIRLTAAHAFDNRRRSWPQVDQVLHVREDGGVRYINIRLVVNLGDGKDSTVDWMKYNAADLRLFRYNRLYFLATELVIRL